jgi:hypothetical protein
MYSKILISLFLMSKFLCCALIAVLFTAHATTAQEFNLLAANVSKSFPVAYQTDKDIRLQSVSTHPDSSTFPLSLFEDSDPKVYSRSFIMPAALITAGSITMAAKSLDGVDLYARDNMYRDGQEDKIKIDNYTMFVPWVSVYGLHLAGIKGQHKAGEATILYAMSSIISNSIVYSTKALTGIERPNGKSHAFPSGHTAQAFVSAEFMRQEYKGVSPWYGAAGYAVAIGTGVLRMYHNKHWFTDVVTGAGVGILSTRFSYWAYPKLKKALGYDKKTDLIVAPTYSDGAYGVSLVYRF